MIHRQERIAEHHLESLVSSVIGVADNADLACLSQSPGERLRHRLSERKCHMRGGDIHRQPLPREQPPRKLLDILISEEDPIIYRKIVTTYSHPSITVSLI